MPRKRKSNLSQCSAKARAQKNARAQESQEQTQARLTADAERHADHRAAETFEQSQARRALDAERHRVLRSQETLEKTHRRQKLDADRHASTRAAETIEQTQVRQLLDSERHASLRAAESLEQSQARRLLDSERHASVRAAESLEQSQARRLLDSERHASVRAAESLEQSQARRLLDSERHASLRAAETLEQSHARRLLDADRHAERRRTFARNTWEGFKDAAFDYDPTIDYVNHNLVNIGRMILKCRYCEALKWKDETNGMCCSGGKNSLPLLGEPEEPLKTLMLHESDESKRFLNNIRKYNSCFQMTSFGVDREVVMPGFSPTFTIQGQIYHRVGSLLPPDNQQHNFLQIYFLGDETLEADRRCTVIHGVERETVLILQRMMHEHNRLINTFKTALEILPGENYKLVMHPDRTPSGEHERRYNAPLINEVAAMVTGEQFATRDIILHLRDNRLNRVPDTHKYYDALQYPIIFSRGQEGYHFQISQINPVTRLPVANKKVSCMDFYAYHMMIRENDFNIIPRCRQLAHQFYVDMYVKVESERLRYISLNQSKLRAENYIHLQDAVTNDANINPNNLGKMVILPSSFVNSPRYLHEYTQDAFVYVRTYGRPDLFVTFTCNSGWHEIVEELMTGQKAIDRHDVVARVFRLKVKKLMDVITKGKIFGEMLCFMYSVEWQKRGLPHVHILLWLKQKLRSDEIDNIICAEIPDPIGDKALHDIIVKNMIHGPCGPENPQSPCMKDGKCTKKFPRKLIKETVHNDNGYPMYRRRAPADGGRTANIKLRNGSDSTIDNSWVVPYSPILSKMFNAHINVEACNSVRAIKYICKYINKGSDQAIFNFRNTEVANPVDEVQTYQSGRYVNSNEAVWRLLGFPLHERHPTVTHLSVHLENGERVYFTENNFQERLSSPPKTTLTAFFDLCKKEDFAKTLLYVDLPRYYTWNKTRKEWKRRIQGAPVLDWPGVKSGDALGRVYTVHVSNMECFCLRMLLHHVRGPTSFRDLKKLGDQEFLTFREACEARGLLENNNHWDITMEEAVQCRSASKVRELFAILIATCGLSNPQRLWEKYKNDMADDILHRLQIQNPNVSYNDLIYNEALTMIEDQLINITGKNLSDFGMSRPQRIGEVSNELIRELDYDTDSLMQQITDALPLLNPEQKLVFDTVTNKLASGDGGLFFLDAPGGTGKTFLLNLLLAQIRKDKGIAVAVASSGIAATLLSGGRTAHSVLKLPLNLAQEEMPICNISKNSDRGRMLQQCKLLVWDECTMSHKRAIEALDRTMKDLKSNRSIMGGMIVLLAGDFRQTLPVITRGTQADEINACLKASALWVHVKKFCLTVNMRVQVHNDVQAGQYTAALLKIGEDRMPTDCDGLISLGQELCEVVNNTECLKNNVYPDLPTNMGNREWLCERAILAPTNQIVNQINEEIMSDLLGDVVEYLSVDNVMDTEQVTSYPIEFLNSLELSGVPSHKLRLKVGVPVLLMRNLDAPRLCNGTRLQINHLGRNIVKATIMTGMAKGENVLIPRIPIIPTDLPFQFKRVQFPLKAAFAITINKAQGQTLKVAGIHLEKCCFSHGQLYVACSRVSNPQNLYVFSKDGKTKNIVYKNVLK
ncbi:uncharacterized protein LOC132902069 [Amyelois transitella]|uniref:uncharacterized protein LOC132902069 n=1 Tax=Amyelois transitella TaxID=680683 RepID=UPI00298F7C85|nr:uncharacterized protein LOC132902069 [Amyelois transitella]